MRAWTVGLAVAMFLFVSSISGDVHAYLDAGTGSMMLQMILAGAVGLMAFIRLYWNRLKSVLRMKRMPEDTLSD